VISKKDRNVRCTVMYCTLNMVSKENFITRHFEIAGFCVSCTYHTYYTYNVNIRET
jgi:hypothetical protein